MGNPASHESDKAKGKEDEDAARWDDRHPVPLNQPGEDNEGKGRWPEARA